MTGLALPNGIPRIDQIRIDIIGKHSKKLEEIVMKNLKNNKMLMIAGMMLLFCSIDLMGVVGEITS